MTLRQRQPRVTDKGFISSLHEQKCCVCGRSPVQAAHIRMGCPERGKRHIGMGEKPDDRWAVPLCAGCHLDDRQAQHKGGERQFWERVGIDPFAVAERLYSEFKGGGPKW